MGIGQELGISAGTAILLLVVFYFVIKWAVKNGVKEAYSEIIDQRNTSDMKKEDIVKELEKDI